MVSGEALAVEEVFVDCARGLLVHVYKEGAHVFDDLLREAQSQSELGVHVAKNFSTFQIGVVCPELALVDESLDAGFTIYIVPAEERIAVHLFAPISDSS